MAQPAAFQPLTIPLAATPFEMNAFFNGPPPFNPLAAVLPVQLGSLAFNQQRAYTAADQSILQQPWPDTKDDTRKRELIRFIIFHGSEDLFDPANNNNYRSVVPQIEFNACPNGVPNPQHWTNQMIRDRALVSNWQEGARHLLNTTTNDARGGMVAQARMVWNQLNPPAGSLWHNHATFPGRLVRIFLFYLREDPQWTPILIKFLLGQRLRPTLDVDALYVGQRAGHLYNSPTGPVDVCTGLVEWLELSCAHMVVEVFNNYFVPARVNPRQLNRNFQDLARNNPNRAWLEQYMDQFPVVA